MAVLDYPGLSYFKGKYDEQVKGILNNIVADEYSSSATYAVGDYVLHDGKLYICKTAIATAEEWTAAHWTEVDISGEVKDLKSSLKSGLEKDAIYHLGFYLDENGDLCQVDEEE